MPATAAARRVSAAAGSRPATRRAPRPSPVRRARAAAPPRPRAGISARSRGITPAAGLLIPVAVGQRTAVAVGDLADSGLVVRLTRGRLWILLLGLLLAGIVALNVLSLSFSASASRTARQADEIERETSALRARLATGLSSEQIQARAAAFGLLVPEPGEIAYLDAGTQSAEQAARRLRDGELSTVVVP